MSETGFMLFQHIVGGTETVLYAACMTFLFYPFMAGQKEQRKNKLGIQFSSEFLYPASDGYDSYDIAIIINNLLQNALEACERMAGGKRYISLSGRQKKRFFLICVKNSFEGEVAFDKNNNLPVSAKADFLGKPASMHGIGLSNVKRETAKYLGNVDVKTKKNEFIVTVLLQERRPAMKSQA